MRKKIKKKNKIKKFNKKPQSSGLLPVLAIVGLLALFSEAMRTLPVGASSEKFLNTSFEVPILSNLQIEKKLIKNTFLINEKFNFETLTNDIIDEDKNDEITITKAITKDLEGVSSNTIDINTVDFPKEEKKIIVTKAPETIIKKNNLENFNEEIIKETLIDKPKLEENIEVAVDTNATKIIVDGEEKLIPASSEKNITYMQILQKPNDLDLNLKYARQQGKLGNHKQTIATLERLSMLYPDNVEIRLYLLSVLVQADSPDKALTVIEEIKGSEDVTPEDLKSVEEIETEIKERKAPKLWNFYADIGAGVIANNNVNSVSKTRLQSSSGSLISFNTPMHDKTYSESLGFTATRSLGEASSFMINTNVSDSRQVTETTDDFESYGLTLALDTSLGNQSLSPYVMLSKTDYQDDADSFSLMGGIGGYFPVGDRNSFSYGYSYSDSWNNTNSTDTSAWETDSIGHGITLGHDFAFNEIISSSLGLGYSISEAEVGTNDFESYDFNVRFNFAFPWAYISIGDAITFNDYMHVDTSITSDRIRSDYVNAFDIMLTKALGDIIPFLDRSKSLFINFSYEKVISEANIINYDYEAESVSMSFSKSFHLNK